MSEQMLSELHLEKVLEYVESLLDGLSTRPRMFAPEMTSCEQLAVRALDIRALALGKQGFDWRRWCLENYPELPGPTRTAAQAMGNQHDGTAREAEFTKEIARMIASERDRQDREGT